MVSSTALPITDVRTNPAPAWNDAGTPSGTCSVQLAGDAEGRYHHFTGRDVLPEEDRPLSHGDRWELGPAGVRHGVTVAFH